MKASSVPATNLKIDADRLWATLTETGLIGTTAKGGICRLALSDEDRHVRDWLVGAIRDAGLDLGIDDMGTMYAVRPGRDMTKPPVAFGSHLDTQPTGGRFDGVLGVLAGLEVMRTLNDAGIETDAPLCLVNWTNEEGARFAPGMIASGVFAGEIDKAWALDRTDRDGIRFGDALQGIGYRGAERPGDRRFAAMIELHIEQGPILEEAGQAIGVVTAAKGMIWSDGRVTGRESHTGSTPMTLRRDALCAFAELVLGVERIGCGEGPDGVATVGVAESAPASRNTIPGEVRFTLDVRHPDLATLERMDAAVDALVGAITGTRDVDITIDRIWRKNPVVFDPTIAATIRAAAEELGYSCREMTSGAGHDACFVASVAPTAMIFVPSQGGISHNESEFTAPADCEKGANVLLHAVLSLARA
jgi:beta-ureidopropionase / N-carbamoyl-L-amino-acid hydrolase